MLNPDDAALVATQVGRPAAPPSRRIALDLYSGTGNATAAFRTAANWCVVTVDNVCDASRRPAVLADARRLPIEGRIDFLWASPPCTEFSDANARVPSVDRRPSLEHIFATLDAVRRLRPRFWILENVRGAIPFLGIPVQKIGPWCLWGYFPPITVTAELAAHRKKPFRSAVARATVPNALSRAVYQAVETYWDFPRLLDMRSMRRHRHVARATAAGLPFTAADDGR